MCRSQLNKYLMLYSLWIAPLQIVELIPCFCTGTGFVGMALSYGLSLNTSFVFFTQSQCNLGNQIISVERVSQYMDIPSEAAEVIEDNRPLPDWPQNGNVEIRDLKVIRYKYLHVHLTRQKNPINTSYKCMQLFFIWLIMYRIDLPLVLDWITCKFEGGDKIGIVGRTGSGKTTLIGALFRLVEPDEGKIIIDSMDIGTIGLHDLRSRLGIIPQDPTLFQGTIRYNLDPLGQFSDQQIWDVRCTQI